MSILSLPRIYFNGYMSWDPPLANNNPDVYDGANAALNYDAINKATQDKNGFSAPSETMTADNFQTIFPDWATDPDNLGVILAWDYFGGNVCKTVNYKEKNTSITGGVLEDGSTIFEGDPLIGESLQLHGNPFNNPGRTSGARFVDINPAGSTTTQLYFARCVVGGDGVQISGDVDQNNNRMFSRSFNGQRQVGYYIAGNMSVFFQGSIPKESLAFDNTSNSKLLEAFKNAMQEDDTLGLQVRFSAFSTLYFQNGVFNDYTPCPTPSGQGGYEQLSELYKKSLAGEIPPFHNPAYSAMSGTVGLWKKGEWATAPNGRILVPVNTIVLNSANPDQYLSPVPANLDSNSDVVSLDLSNSTIMTGGSQFDVADIGDLTVGVTNNGVFTVIGTIPFTADPGQPAYGPSALKQSGGIVDLVVSAQHKELAQTGTLAIHAVDPQSSDTISLLEETALVAETDQRAVYIDQNEEKSITVNVTRKGKPAPGGQIMVAQYFAQANVTLNDQKAKWPVQFAVGEMHDIPVKSSTHSTTVTIVTADNNGEAIITFKANAPGYASCYFLPFDGEAPQNLPIMISGSPDTKNPELSNVSGYFFNIRVMPFDDDQPQDFADIWNEKYDPQVAWDYLYKNILGVYDMLFPVMKSILPLNDRARMEGAAAQLEILISKEYQPESTVYMPITRDLSNGKRKVLEMWISLVNRGYPEIDLTP